MIKVFISSPYTLGNIQANLNIQIDAANELIDAGFNPLPLNLYCHPIESKYPRINYVDWIHLTLELVEKCDCVLRIGGKSRGADDEVEKGKELGKPIFYSVTDLIAHYK